MNKNPAVVILKTPSGEKYSSKPAKTYMLNLTRCGYVYIASGTRMFPSLSRWMCASSVLSQHIKNSRVALVVWTAAWASHPGMYPQDWASLYLDSYLEMPLCYLQCASSSGTRSVHLPGSTSLPAVPLKAAGLLTVCNGKHGGKSFFMNQGLCLR